VHADTASGGNGRAVVAVVAVVVAGMRVFRVGIGLFDGGLVDGSVVGDLFNFRHLLPSAGCRPWWPSIHPSPSARTAHPERGPSTARRLAMEDQRHRGAYLALCVSGADDDGSASPLIVIATDGDLQ